MKHRDDYLAAAAIAASAGLVYLGSRFPTFRLFFGWPNGGTWSNTIAWLEDAAIAALVVWYFRDRIGPRLAAWWHQHHAPHLRGELDELRKHVDRRYEEILKELRRGSDATRT